MSVFASRESRSKLDDTTPIFCVIERFFNQDGHTEFVMKVQRGPNPENKWQVQHRYSDFVTLHSLLQASGFELPLPPKKVFGNMDSAFIQERRVGLQTYLQAVLSSPLLANHVAVKKFLDPRNYSDDIENFLRRLLLGRGVLVSVGFEEMAQQQAAMFFRSEPNWELVEPIKDVGWRIRKHYFTMKSKDSTKNARRILAWTEYGPDMVLDHETSLPALLRQLTTLQHPFIYPVQYASCTDKGSTIVRDFHPSGSLRDYVFKAKPLATQLKKYGNVKLRCPLEFNDVKRCGRQILEALKFLQDKGWPYGHLHTGNVLVDESSCRLLDIENGILGLSPFYRTYMTNIRKIQDTETMDVYCFGHLLYEITFGEPLNRSSVDEFPSNCPPMIQPVLHSILSTSALKNGLPTVADLLSNPLFSDVPVTYAEKPTLKVNKLKDALKAAKDSIEARLKEEQKRLRQFQRLSKAKSELFSEEEKKKRKKTAKKQKSIAEDTSQQSSTSSQNSRSSNETAKMNGTSVTTRKPAISPVPPPPPAAAPPPPKVSSQPPRSPPPSGDRSSLLNSISGFKKGGLKKTETNDRSAPKLSN